MQEWKIAYVNQREIPVLISDEKEALLAAKAAGRAIVGLWRPGQAMDEISAAKYVVENPEDVTEGYLERVARRHLGLPWHICETERVLIREMYADDFDEIWENQIGLGFGTVEELQAYTQNQYQFYGFGFWALVDKESRELVGVAGLKVPENADNAEMQGSHPKGHDSQIDILTLTVSDADDSVNRKTETMTEQNLSAQFAHEPEEESEEEKATLELGYHIFPQFRRCGYAKEACQGILKYGAEELGVSRFMVRIEKENIVSRHLAESLGFLAGN